MGNPPASLEGSAPARPTAAVLAVAAFGCLLLALCMRWGAGVSPDSVVYLDMARNLLEGHGPTRWTPEGYRVVANFPPGYPTLLAGAGLLGPDPLPAARWLNLAIFATSIVLMGVLMLRCTGRRPIALLAAAFYATSEITLEIHSMVWSETIFMLLGFSGLYVLSVHLDRNRRLAIAGSAVLIALAVLTRFAGIAFVATGLIALLRRPARLGTRLRDGLAFLTVTLLPVGFLLWRNAQLAGTSTAREYGFYPLSSVRRTRSSSSSPSGSSIWSAGSGLASSRSPRWTGALRIDFSGPCCCSSSSTWSR